MTPTKTPAARLAAVLRVVRTDRKWVIYEAGYAWVQEAGDGFTPGYRGEKFKPDSKDDLARVVAMLTPEQRYKFDLHFHQLYGGGAGDWLAQWNSAITAPASVWLDALAAATGVEG